jgi:iron complex transport system permease protein
MEASNFNINRKSKYAVVFGLFFLFMLLTVAVAPLIGQTQISLMKALSGGPNAIDNIDANIFFMARLPRIFLAFVAGSALAVAGSVFQAILRNDLAAPITLGVSGGAALGAVAAIRLGFTMTLFGFSMVSIFAFSGSLLALVIVFSLVRARRGELPTSVLLLAGVTVNFFFASLVMLIHYLSNTAQSFQIVRWLMGGVDVIDFQTTIAICPLIIIGIITLIYISRDLNMISSGVQSAQSRGVNVALIQFVGLLAASILTGAVVAVTGPIGFVGLVVPHITRLIVGPDHRILIPTTVLFGGSFLIICDTVARTIIAPTEIPVGVITAIIGGPFFFWLLRKQLGTIR